MAIARAMEARRSMVIPVSYLPPPPCPQGAPAEITSVASVSKASVTRIFLDVKCATAKSLSERTACSIGGASLSNFLPVPDCYYLTPPLSPNLTPRLRGKAEEAPNIAGRDSLSARALRRTALPGGGAPRTAKMRQRVVMLAEEVLQALLWGKAKFSQHTATLVVDALCLRPLS